MKNLPRETLELLNVKNTVVEKLEEVFSFLKDNSLLEFLLILITDIIKK